MDIPDDVVQAVQDAQWAVLALDGVTGIVLGLHHAPMWNVGTQAAYLLEQLEIRAWPPGWSALGVSTVWA